MIFLYCLHPITYTVCRGDNLYQLSRYYQTSVQAILAANPDIDPYNLQIGETMSICPGEGFITQPINPNPAACPNPAARIALINDMREAWEQHIYWTRLLLISIAERLKDQDATTTRLLRNPKDIGDIFAGYYNEATALTIEKLLTEHLQIGAKIITALRDKQNAQAETLTLQWYANADQMAEAFSGINPYYTPEEMRKMLYSHLDLTTQEVKMRIAEDYPADIKAFDQVEQEALKMADYFSSGIIRQFPNRFH